MGAVVHGWSPVWKSAAVVVLPRVRPQVPQRSNCAGIPNGNGGEASRRVEGLRHLTDDAELLPARVPGTRRHQRGRSRRDEHDQRRGHPEAPGTGDGGRLGLRQGHRQPEILIPQGQCHLACGIEAPANRGDQHIGQLVRPRGIPALEVGAGGTRGQGQLTIAPAVEGLGFPNGELRQVGGLPEGLHHLSGDANLAPAGLPGSGGDKGRGTRDGLQDDRLGGEDRRQTPRHPRCRGPDPGTRPTRHPASIG